MLINCYCTYYLKSIHEHCKLFFIPLFTGYIVCRSFHPLVCWQLLMLLPAVAVCPCLSVPPIAAVRRLLSVAAAVTAVAVAAALAAVALLTSAIFKHAAILTCISKAV